MQQSPGDDLPSYCLNQSRYVAHQLLDRCDLPLVLVHGCAADGPPRWATAILHHCRSAGSDQITRRLPGRAHPAPTHLALRSRQVCEAASSDWINKVCQILSGMHIVETEISRAFLWCSLNLWHRRDLLFPQCCLHDCVNELDFLTLCLWSMLSFCFWSMSPSRGASWIPVRVMALLVFFVVSLCQSLSIPFLSTMPNFSNYNARICTCLMAIKFVDHKSSQLIYCIWRLNLFSLHGESWLIIILF